MLRPSDTPSAEASCEGYRILRSLSSRGVIVGREPPEAQTALIELGLEEVQQPSRPLDELLLAETRKNDHQGAFLCLRCRVSWPLEQKIRAMHRQLAANYGVELVELAAFSLDDIGRPLSYIQANNTAGAKRPAPFTVEVIRTYEPEQSSLSHWARQRLDGRNDLKAYLLQQGVKWIGDWALLGDSSHKQVREAATQLSGRLTAEAAEALHRRYLPLYRKEKLLYRQRTGRQRGWEPDEVFLRLIAPELPPQRIREDLLDIAAAVRRLQTGHWQKAEADLWDTDACERWADTSSSQADEDDPLGTEVAQLMDRVGSAFIEQMVSQLEGEVERRIWQAWASGLRQRQIADHCGTNQARVSRTLQEERRAGEIATLVIEQLRRSVTPERDVFWTAIFRSLQSQRQAEERLMNHLLRPEQEGGISPMHRWVKQALDSTDPAGGCDDGTGAGGAS
ncbi:hypothetical protein [Synechococcus sp. EJ6-Ellesmere]|uniref:hypothetical protein n=1 Tax=Synechococcus sp. EJ6-Ellesmere TaxID=2823734 RepID=UPI0020CE446C|nr:hypothetical protein [Synechococcus sp. EJ6-Ellesmere]MCP9826226.1 hypothetical protein [Synechococcus sp. EJ6-Ellesmere]